jgi:hypothetical protein
MRVIIAGSRGIEDYQLVQRAIQKAGIQITQVVSGAARGVDRLGERFGVENQIPVRRFPAKWDLHGKAAGYRRNEEMAKNADALIAIGDGHSKGTAHMVETAKKYGLLIRIEKVQ